MTALDLAEALEHATVERDRLQYELNVALWDCAMKHREIVTLEREIGRLRARFLAPLTPWGLSLHTEMDRLP